VGSCDDEEREVLALLFDVAALVESAIVLDGEEEEEFMFSTKLIEGKSV